MRDSDSDATPSKAKTAALNAASRVVGEVRKSLGVRAAARAAPGIFAMVGVDLPLKEPEQGELDLKDVGAAG
jgi:hypothetical protein